MRRLGQVTWELGVCRMQAECHGHCGHRKAWLELGHPPLCGPASRVRAGGKPHFQVTCAFPELLCPPSPQQGPHGEAEEVAHSISGKDYIKAVYYHPAYLTSMQSTSAKYWPG